MTTLEYAEARARHPNVRVMFTTTGSAGHLGPLMPFADAVRRGDPGRAILRDLAG